MNKLFNPALSVVIETNHKGTFCKPVHFDLIEFNAIKINGKYYSMENVSYGLFILKPYELPLITDMPEAQISCEEYYQEDASYGQC